MNFIEAIDELRWRLEGCLIGFWFKPIFAGKSKTYPLRWYPIPRVSYFLMRFLYLEDFV